jgi:hypothetical protein
MIKQWFEEYLSSVGGLFSSKEHNFILYKGFKIINEQGTYRIQDVRRNDFYSEVFATDLAMFKEHGFVRGADLIMYNRDVTRVRRYTSRLEMTYTRRDHLRGLPPEGRPKGYAKAVNTVDKKIRECVDKIFFFQTRLKQTAIKLKLDEQVPQT